CLSVTTMAPWQWRPAWWHGERDPWCGAAQQPRQGKDPDPYPDLSASQPGRLEAPPLCATHPQPDLLLHTPCHSNE
ncbi:hypothetical protein M9458_045106, partial [Cirrhinus mrigala]